MKKYDMAKEDIQQANPHIANVEALLPSMKVKIPSISKSVQTISTPKKKRSKQPHQQLGNNGSEKQTKSSHEVLYAQAHRRPMGEAMSYDHRQTQAMAHKQSHEQVTHQPTLGICCHCHQPIYPSPPFTS